MSCAIISRFYGISPDEIADMTVKTFNEYFKAVKILKAQEQIDKLEVATYPKLKDAKARSKINKRLQKELKNGEPDKYMSPHEIARMLKDGR